jgi:hypothetical protein
MQTSNRSDTRSMNSLRSWFQKTCSSLRALGSAALMGASVITSSSAFVGMAALLGTVAVLGSTVGCHPQVIPNTDVEDTSENRAIIDFCENYRRAVERRNIPQLLKLAHSKYYEDGGNVDSSDDLDKAGLQKYLEGKFADTRAIRYEIRYRRIGKGREKQLYVDYTYSASYQLPTPEGEVWRRTVAENRLELIPVGEAYQILSGM